MKPKITILAGVVPYFYYKRSLKINYKLFLKKYRGYLPRPFEVLMYGGHYGVSRSMIEGLQGLNENVNYNPSRKKDIGDVVIVIGDINALRQAIELKQQKKIKKLIAGPNLCVFPTDFREIAAKEIDVYITHATWCVDYFIEMLPVLKNKMKIWPVGIDENYWKPLTKTKKNGKTLLFFKKYVDDVFYNKCLIIAKENGFEVIELIRGGYTFEQYKQLLSKVDFLVHFTEHESQGISLSESWAMNVPTMVWSTGVWNHEGNNIKCSSAPFLNNENGRFFKNEIEFDKLFKTQQFLPDLYQPRKWVLENLTDRKSASILTNIINSIDVKN